MKKAIVPSSSGYYFVVYTHNGYTYHLPQKSKEEALEKYNNYKTVWISYPDTVASMYVARSIAPTYIPIGSDEYQI